MTKIQDKLFLGTWVEAKNLPWLRQSKISHILSAAPEVGFIKDSGIKYKILPILDVENFDAYPYFDISANYIKETLEDSEECTGLLVHDFKGESRGAAMIAAYIMKYQGLNFPMSYRAIMTKRNEARIEKWYTALCHRFCDECTQQKNLIGKLKLAEEETRKKEAFLAPVNPVEKRESLVIQEVGTAQNTKGFDERKSSYTSNKKSQDLKGAVSPPRISMSLVDQAALANQILQDADKNLKTDENLYVPDPEQSMTPNMTSSKFLLKRSNNKIAGKYFPQHCSENQLLASKWGIYNQKDKRECVYHVNGHRERSPQYKSNVSSTRVDYNPPHTEGNEIIQERHNSQEPVRGNIRSLKHATGLFGSESAKHIRFNKMDHSPYQDVGVG